MPMNEIANSHFVAIVKKSPWGLLGSSVVL